MASNDKESISTLVQTDPWQHLKTHTAARIALGRTGVSLPTHEVLDFGLAHAMARDAVHLPLDTQALQADLIAANFSVLQVQSAVDNRQAYLLRPDLGRRLNEASAALLNNTPTKGFDLTIVVADGLSSMAIKHHALPMILALRQHIPATWQVAPMIVATQARVALSDEIGQLLQSKLVLMLVGERPGLSSPDSLGVYLTYDPKIGKQDAERNCISNIRAEGLSYPVAAHKAMWLAAQALQLKCTGVGLKDESSIALIKNTDNHRNENNA